MLIPSATYRIQFHKEFTFRHLADITAYLSDLKVNAVYASPILAAVQGSKHGYDGTDPRVINPEIGTLEELRSVTSILRDKGIGWIQDIVPNHLAFHTDNPWLYDVFERGIYSSYAHHFDIDWDHPTYTHKLIAPVLGQQPEDCIRDKQINLHFDHSGFSLRYADYCFPIRLEQYSFLANDCLNEYADAFNEKLNNIIAGTNLPHNVWIEKKAAIIDLLQKTATISLVEKRLNELNKDGALLLQILKEQHYQLCKFSHANNEINYRRFFNINALISLRMEDEQVFHDYHRLIHQLYKDGIITGLRIDHIDGLKNPREYVDRLRKLFGKDCYIIAEKILDIKEQLPPLDIQGTSGYEFLSYTNQLITDTTGADILTRIYEDHAPGEKNYDLLVFNNKLENLQNSLNGDWDNLVRIVKALQVFTHYNNAEIIKQSIGAFMAAYPVYRAYIEKFPLNDAEWDQVNTAIDNAIKYRPDLSTEIQLLKKIFEPEDDPAENDKKLAVIQRLMQFTGPMAAKGVEDTTFYQYNTLISHNEVGDAPCVLGISVKTFHEKMQQRNLFNPASMNSTATHDTKRGEDARMRINLLSELTGEWNNLISSCQAIASQVKHTVDGLQAPSLNDEYFLYQTIIGSLPDDLNASKEYINRTKEYFIKALRESKLNTDHIAPNDAYEKASLDFIDVLLDRNRGLLPLLSGFVHNLLPYSRVYSLAQLIIKLTAPGIPDIYQGCELWDYSYVDPDNRRPVDYDLRKNLLREISAWDKGVPPDKGHLSTQQHQLGIHKLWITQKLLKLRLQTPGLFNHGTYTPVYAPDNERNVVSYLRQHESEWILIVLPLGIVSGRHLLLNIQLPPNAPDVWENIFTSERFTGRVLNTGQLYDRYPVAVLYAKHG